ncbi:MAG: hypothetical protein KGL39_00750 [Patescibacteria group bacterium]|nr:hypothetical protein [Patescibacteria group bacterium]
MAISKKFLLAGNAIFTIESVNPNYRPHYTYRIQKVEASDRWKESYFVKLLAGPDNTSDYIYLGKLDTFTGQVIVTAKSERQKETFPFRLLNRILARVWADDHTAYEQYGYQTHHAGRCGRCGKVLTVPTSIETGLGPECQKILS